MNIVYLQCDLRYNTYLLEILDGVYVINHTINRLKKINCPKIIAGIYECVENMPLAEILREEGIQIIMSVDENVDSRFLDSVIEENADYVIRVNGDQCLLDTETTKYILSEMKQQGSEWFYEKSAASVLPDVVDIRCLRKYKSNILNEGYARALEKEDVIRRHCLLYPYFVLYDFRASTETTTRVCRCVIEKKVDIHDLQKTLAMRLQSKDNYLNKTGILGSWLWKTSYEDVFMDENKQVNPWWAESIIDLIRNRINRSLSVFEWGSGNSTLFWSQNVGRVISIEYDLTWYNRMKNMIPDNVELVFCELEYDGDYCRRILKEGEKFDIILVDGRDRVRCAQNAVERIKMDGIIIWDDTERKEYQTGYNFLKEHGYKQMELSGITYGIELKHFTSIFYKKNNLLGL